ncbi:MAG: nitroreductase family protein [Candidatus Hodarchaeales archaeon]|jgi:nitroreductase
MQNIIGHDFMAVKEIISERRAYRSLEPVTITNELIYDLAAAAQLAPSCFNNQPWRYVFVHDETVLKTLYGALSRGNVWAHSSSLIIAVVSQVDLSCRIKGRDYYLFDTGLATGFILLRATELGLVAHPIAGYDEDQVKKILDIPKEMQVITLLVVGKHAAQLSAVLSEKQQKTEKQRPKRLSFEKFAFVNSYRNTI